jgi:cell division protein ZapB
MAMEILSKLEARIDEMLVKMRDLEKEKARLAEKLESGSSELEAENRRLKDELDRERASKEAVVARIDALLAKLSGEEPKKASAAPMEADEEPEAESESFTFPME